MLMDCLLKVTPVGHHHYLKTLMRQRFTLLDCSALTAPNLDTTLKQISLQSVNF